MQGLRHNFRRWYAIFVVLIFASFTALDNAADAAGAPVSPGEIQSVDIDDSSDIPETGGVQVHSDRHPGSRADDLAAITGGGPGAPNAMAAVLPIEIAVNPIALADAGVPCRDGASRTFAEILGLGVHSSRAGPEVAGDELHPATHRSVPTAELSVADSRLSAPARHTDHVFQHRYPAPTPAAAMSLSAPPGVPAIRSAGRQTHNP